MKKILYLGTALFVSAVHGVDQISTALQTTQENVTQNAIKELFDSFIPAQLTEEDHALFHELKLSILAKAQPASEKITPEQETKKVEALLLVCEYEKALRAKFELVATQQPLITERLQSLQLKGLEFLHRKLQMYLSSLFKKGNAAEFFTISPAILASEAKKIITRSKISPNGINLAYDYYSSHPTLCALYNTVMLQYRAGNYEQLSTHIDDALYEHEKERQALDAQLSSPKEWKNKQLRDAQTIITRFMKKLCAIKTELEYFLIPRDPLKTILLTRYLAITTNPEIDKALKNKEFSILYNNMQKIFTTFRTTNTLPNQIIYDLVTTLEKSQKYLKYNNEHTQASLFTLFHPTQKPNSTYLLVSDIASLLENTGDYIAAQTEDPFTKDLLSYTTITPKQSKDEATTSPYLRIALETANRMTGKNFTNIKDVALYCLSNASPAVTAYILGMVLPQLKPDTKQALTALFAQREDKKAPTEPLDKSFLDQLNKILEEETIDQKTSAA